LREEEKDKKKKKKKKKGQNHQPMGARFRYLLSAVWGLCVLNNWQSLSFAGNMTAFQAT
jgi:hypothetical protein